MRVRSPSTTLTFTSTVSPGAKSGISLPADSLVTCSCSSFCNKFMGILHRGSAGHQWRASLPVVRVGRASTTPCGVCHPSETCGLWRFLGLAAAGQVGRPEVRTALLCGLFGFGAPPGLDLGVVAGGQHRRDLPALPDLW